MGSLQIWFWQTWCISYGELDCWYTPVILCSCFWMGLHKYLSNLLFINQQLQIMYWSQTMYSTRLLCVLRRWFVVDDSLIMLFLLFCGFSVRYLFCCTALSRWGRESWLRFFNCPLGIMWLFMFCVSLAVHCCTALSRWGRESWFRFFNCPLGIMWLLMFCVSLAVHCCTALSRWGRESWLRFFNCPLGIMWLLMFCVSLAVHCAEGWSAVYDCGISWTYSLASHVWHFSRWMWLSSWEHPCYKGEIRLSWPCKIPIERPRGFWFYNCCTMG